jgi:hypothetical protein
MVANEKDGAAMSNEISLPMIAAILGMFMVQNTRVSEGWKWITFAGLWLLTEGLILFG